MLNSVFCHHITTGSKYVGAVTRGPTPSDSLAATCQVGCGAGSYQLGYELCQNHRCHPHHVPAQGWEYHSTCVAARCKKRALPRVKRRESSPRAATNQDPSTPPWVSASLPVDRGSRRGRLPRPARSGTSKLWPQCSGVKGLGGAVRLSGFKPGTAAHLLHNFQPGACDCFSLWCSHYWKWSLRQSLSHRAARVKRVNTGC